MTKPYDEGTRVKWSWGNGEATGKVVKSYTKRVERKIDGNEVTRNADDDNPAYYIEQEDGDHALKSHSEVEKA